MYLITQYLLLFLFLAISEVAYSHILSQSVVILEIDQKEQEKQKQKSNIFLGKF